MNLKIEILRALNDRLKYMAPEPTLLSEVRHQTGLPVTVAEFASALAELDRNQLVSGVYPELGGPLKWKITDKGRATYNTAI